MATPPVLEAVLPAHHDPDCRRGSDPALPFYALDTDRCERCRQVRVVLREVHRRAMERLAR